MENKSKESQHVSHELSRDLSLFHVTMMGLGMMIGAGVFIGTGRAIGVVGPGGVLLTFALGGLIAIFTAMSYAELSSAIPRAGGAFNFARIGFGRGTSFVAGWMEWFASSVAGSLYAVCFATYTVRFFTGMKIISHTHEGIIVKITAVVIASLFIYINYRGTSETGKIGAIMTLLQTSFLVVIGAIGIYVAMSHPERLQNFKPFLNPDNGWSGLLVTMGITAVAFEGYEVIAQAGDETINPKKNIPKAMLYSVIIVTFTYIVCAFATVVAVEPGANGLIDGIAPWKWIGNHGAKGFGAAVEQLMPSSGGLLVMLAVIFASTSALNATVYSATRASYALGRDHLLPPFFSRISKARKTPWIALAFTGLIVIVIAGFMEVEQVTESASIMFLLLFFLVNICVIRIRYNMGDELQYGFLMPFFPLFPVLAIICQGVLAVFLLKVGWIAWTIAIIWIGSGILIYIFYSKSRAIATEDEIMVLEEDSSEVEDKYKIMVSLANPDNALSLVRQTHAISHAKKARLELLHMVPVPDQVQLSDAEDYMIEGREAFTEALLYLGLKFPINTTISYCRNVARGIINTVRRKSVDMLIMGWQGPTEKQIFKLGSTVDPVIDRVPCRVVVMKDCGDKKFKRILVPIAGGPNGAFALEIAEIIASNYDGEIVVLTVVLENTKTTFDLERFIDDNLDTAIIQKDKIRIKSILAKDTVSAIIDESENSDENYDLVVIGSTLQNWIRQVLTETIPEAIAKKCQKPLIMVKSSGGIRSFIRRWI